MRRNVSNAARGGSLAGLVVALAVFALLAAAAAARLAPAARGPAALAAARDLAARWRSLARAARADGRDRAIVFPLSGGDEPLVEAADGDGDGVGRDDIARGVDAAGPPFTIARDHPGARIGKPRRRLPAVPPSTGFIEPDDPAVRFGPSRMAVVTAEGHATPGSLFVTSGGSVCAVVIHGAALRIRIYCLSAGGAWRRR
ncbi:MAG: hypothetical protein D6718_09070 [Acidobacteria bacterium]|nr:MAG: hypothetical protein D6718_09070 [Acidobacteriota bacterium]